MRSFIAILIAFNFASIPVHARSPVELVQAEPDRRLTMPNALQGLLQSLSPELAQTLLQSTVNALVVTIQQAHDEAAQTARPMPQRLQQVLAPYFPSDLLTTVRFTTSARANVGMSALLMEQNARVNAVTLNDIIVFRGDEQAANPCLWAHELVHVQQYARMGVEGFATLYATRFDELENPAYDYEQKVCQRLLRD